MTRKARTTPRRRRSPERTCVVCHVSVDKRQLVRVARMRDGTVTLDPSNKGPGRGAYVCRDGGCWQHDGLAAQLSRALRSPVTPEALEELQQRARSLVE